ncbi:MAG: MFS transporter [Rhodobacteraceae bacterium]|nr:MFS transporter [Paracoccaceae bacterium]
MTSNRTVDITTVIDSAHVSSFQIRTIALCFVLSMVDGFDMQAIAYVAPAMAADWGVAGPSFGPVFGIGLLGSTIGTVLFGPAGDRFGRKTVLIPSILVFGTCSILTISASTMDDLMIYRLITGIGLGGALPNIIALASEYAPKRRRASLVTIMFCGFPFGAVVGGIISARLIPAYGWEAVFILGGGLALVALPVTWFLMPESIRFLAMRQGMAEKAAAILRRIDPAGNFSDSDRFVIGEHAMTGATVRLLFTEKRAFGTLMIWTLFFMSLLLSYFMVNWLPLALQQAGLPLTAAVLATATLNAGGIVGCIVFGRVIDKRGPYTIIGTAYLIGAVFVGAIGFAASSAPVVMAVVFAAGFFAIGAQFCAVALVTEFYATAIRATGVGWSMGIGRIGSMIGPVVGGVLLGAGLGIDMLFLCAAITPVLAGLAVFAMARSPQNAAASQSAASH